MRILTIPLPVSAKGRIIQSSMKEVLENIKNQSYENHKNPYYGSHCYSIDE